jgi:hypothetical protein
MEKDATKSGRGTSMIARSQITVRLAIVFTTLFLAPASSFAESKAGTVKTTACPPDAIGQSGYVGKLTKRIQTEWNKTPYPKKSKHDTTIGFVIKKSGEISELKLKNRSGNSKQDQAVIKTIEQLSPLEALPADAPDTVSVELSLGKRRD